MRASTHDIIRSCDHAKSRAPFAMRADDADATTVASRRRYPRFLDWIPDPPASTMLRWHSLLLGVGAATLLGLVAAAPSHAAKPSAQPVPACVGATAPARAVLAVHNKHCVPTEPPPPPPPPPPPCTSTGPSPIASSVQAGPFVVTKIGPHSVSVANPSGGLSASTELDLMVDGTAYGFTKGSIVPWFTLPWSDTEVRVENWSHFDGKSLSAVGFYAYPSGYLFGGWQQLNTPIVMGDPPADACTLTPP